MTAPNLQNTAYPPSPFLPDPAEMLRQLPFMFGRPRRDADPEVITDVQFLACWMAVQNGRPHPFPPEGHQLGKGSE